MCDNCGAIIAAVVSIEDTSPRRVYHIGTDCADTLRRAGAIVDGMTHSRARFLDVDLMEYNKAARVAAEANKGKAVLLSYMFATVTNDKGKAITCGADELRRYFPQAIKQHTNA